jgi:uncharacterized protein (DUF1015 family)
VSLIKPFRALRPVPEKAQQVSCMPYDVAPESEVRDFIAKNPESFLRVTRPEAEFDSQQHPTAADILEKAKENLQELIGSGVMEHDPGPALYIYRLSTGTHTQTGVVACCSLDEYELGLIKKHEKTRPDKVKDRTEHMLALRAQTGLIFLTYRGTERIDELVLEITKSDPLYDFTCSAGIRHEVWRVAAGDELMGAFSEVPALYVADGHHRIESAEQARELLRAEDPDYSDCKPYNYVLAGIFPAEELRILPYNRIVHDLDGFSEEEFLEQLKENFAVEESGKSEPSAHGEIAMFLSGKWYTLRLDADDPVEAGPIERLDVSILQNYILGPLLGIHDPRTDKRIEFVGGARGTRALEHAVNSGSARVAFSLFPTTMEDLFVISDMGEIMPPKSTWFEPKLKDGLFVHLI